MGVDDSVSGFAGSPVGYTLGANVEDATIEWQAQGLSTLTGNSLNNALTGSSGQNGGTVGSERYRRQRRQRRAVRPRAGLRGGLRRC